MSSAIRLIEKDCILVSASNCFYLDNCQNGLIKDDLIYAVPGTSWAIFSVKSPHFAGGGNTFLDNVIHIPNQGGPPDGILMMGLPQPDIAAGNIFPGWPATTSLISD